MNLRVGTIVLVGFLLGVPVSGRAAPPAGTTSPAPAERARLEGEVSDLAAFGFSGAVLVKDGGRTVARMGLGVVKPGGPPATTSTVFEIASLAKQFTATAILALKGDGKLALADTVGRFFPEAPSPIAAIHIEQLLVHSSGLMRGNVTGDGGDRAECLSTPRDSALARIFQSQLRFAPGSKQSYSNAGYVLLAAIIEKASGRPYNDYLRERILARAGMNDTRFWGERGQAVAAHGYDDVGELFNPDGMPLPNWAIRGSGAVLTSIDDLERYVDALTRGKILPATVVKDMMTAHYESYGYGWRIGAADSKYAGAVYHGGDYYGVGSQLIWDQEKKRLIVILCNVRDEDDTYSTRVVAEDAIFAALDGSPRNIPQVRGAAHAAGLAGDYAAADGSRFAIAKTTRGLVLGAMNQEAVDFLWAPADTTRAYWQALSRRTEDLMRACLASDTAGVRQTLAATDDPPYVYEQLRREQRTLAGERALSGVKVLGTWPAASPKGALWTVMQLRTEGEALPYRLRWFMDNVASYHLRAPVVASGVPLAASDSGWVAWNPVSPSAPIMVSRGKGSSLVLRRGEVSLEVSPQK